MKYKKEVTEFFRKYGLDERNSVAEIGPGHFSLLTTYELPFMVKQEFRSLFHSMAIIDFETTRKNPFDLGYHVDEEKLKKISADMEDRVRAGLFRMVPGTPYLPIVAMEDISAGATAEYNPVTGVLRLKPDECPIAGNSFRPGSHFVSEGVVNRVSRHSCDDLVRTEIVLSEIEIEIPVGSVVKVHGYIVKEKTK